MTSIKHLFHRTSDQTLRDDLAHYDTQADLIELAGILDRNDDAAANQVRDLVDWTRAA